MKNIAIPMCGLIIALIGGNCQRNGHNTTVAEVLPSQAQTSQTLTLSGNQLIFLDWDGGISSGARVVRKRLVPYSGVEFDIHFPSNGPGYNSIDYVSSGAGGQGTLVGFDVSEYKVFSLRFTLVSIDGATGSDMTQELVVGAVIGPTAEGRLSGYTPVTISFASRRTTAVSTIPIFGVSNIYQIGIHAHMAKPENWNPSGSMVTIRVDPVDKNEEPVMAQRQNAVESVNVISPPERDINKKAYVEQARGMEAFLENMKVALYIVNGKKEGLCITGLDDLNMAGNFGFENGDVIQTINGQMVTNKKKAFQVLKKARSQSSLNFQLLRNKQKMALSFEIK
jgi:hypothetical protein